MKIKKIMNSFASTEPTPVRKVGSREQVRKDRATIEKINQLRQWRAKAYESFFNVGNEQRPDAKQLEAEFDAEIRKCDMELAGLGFVEGDQEYVDNSFFRVGGTQVDFLPSDSAFDVRGAELINKSAANIPLDNSPMGTQTDSTEVAKVDLGSGFKL